METPLSGDSQGEASLVSLAGARDSPPPPCPSCASCLGHDERERVDETVEAFVAGARTRNPDPAPSERASTKARSDTGAPSRTRPRVRPASRHVRSLPRAETSREHRAGGGGSRAGGSRAGGGRPG